VRPAAPLIGDWAKGILGNSGGVGAQLAKTGRCRKQPVNQEPSYD